LHGHCFCAPLHAVNSAELILDSTFDLSGENHTM
jgi:hypothetical protein